jgi:hypothetical protein
MGQETYSDYDGEGQPETGGGGRSGSYWRRRVITLCAGLALLALLAWAFSGGGKAPSTAQKGSSQASGILPAAAYSNSSAAPSPGASGSASSASASAGSAATLLFPAVTPSRGTNRATSGKSARAAAAGASNAAGAGGTGVEPGGGCAPGAVVLSLFTSRGSYYAGQYPSFQIDAVSTASRTCSFDLSPHRLHVQVMSSGRIIWDSADCTRGEPNRSIQLRRGVPAEASATWHRTISLPGCVIVASSARLGSYQVQATDSSVASPVRSFNLVR